MSKQPITTEQVQRLIADAAHSHLSREQVIEQLTEALQRSVDYLALKAERRRRTAYIVALEHDVEALARAIHLLQEKEK